MVSVLGKTFGGWVGAPEAGANTPNVPGAADTKIGNGRCVTNVGAVARHFELEHDDMVLRYAALFRFTEHRVNNWFNIFETGPTYDFPGARRFCTSMSLAAQDAYLDVGNVGGAEHGCHHSIGTGPEDFLGVERA